MQKSTVTPGKMPLIIRRKPELERDTKRIHLLRRMVQVGFFTLIGYHVVGTLVVGEDSSIASPEAYCPFGGLETLYSYISTGGRYVPHTHLSNLVLLVAVLALTLVSKSAFCGWICPLGALQDWLFNLRRFFYRGKSPLHLPPLVDRVARSIKYLVLAWLLIETALAAKMAFREYDPYSALLNLGKEVALGGLIVLVVTVVLALFVERPWCTYACPLGATIGLLGRLSLFKIRRDEKTCLSGCTLCNRACPSGLEVKKFKTLATSDCVNCMSCVAGCPTGALAVRLPGLLRSTKNQAQSELVTANSSSPSEEGYREI